MNSIDQQFIEYIVKSLVGNPDAVKVERRIDEKGVLLELIVDPEDLGRVIGKRGATAQSLRTLLRALGTKNDARYNLKIVDTGPPRERSSEPRSDDRPPQGKASDDKPTEDAIADPVVDDPVVATDDGDEVDATKEEKDHSDVVSRTRAELAEFDDLEV
jgi:uncharacterized protein